MEIQWKSNKRSPQNREGRYGAEGFVSQAKAGEDKAREDRQVGLAN